MGLAFPRGSGRDASLRSEGGTTRHYKCVRHCSSRALLLSLLVAALWLAVQPGISGEMGLMYSAALPCSLRAEYGKQPSICGSCSIWSSNECDSSSPNAVWSWVIDSLRSLWDCHDLLARSALGQLTSSENNWGHLNLVIFSSHWNFPWSMNTSVNLRMFSWNITTTSTEISTRQTLHHSLSSTKWHLCISNDKKCSSLSH